MMESDMVAAAVVTWAYVASLVAWAGLATWRDRRRVRRSFRPWDDSEFDD